MTDKPEPTVDTAVVAKRLHAVRPAADGVDAELIGRLVEQARAAGVQLTGDGGLHQLKRVLESAWNHRRSWLRQGRRRGEGRLRRSRRQPVVDGVHRGRSGPDRGARIKTMAGRTG